jgi:hypothetical protein
VHAESPEVKKFLSDSQAMDQVGSLERHYRPALELALNLWFTLIH